MKFIFKSKLICLLIVFLLVIPSLFTVYAAEYNVTAETEKLVFKGNASAEANKEYEFSFDMEEDVAVKEIFSEIAGSLPLSKNKGEGTSASTTFFEKTEDTTAFPEIKMVEDNDSPMRDVLIYKRVITDSINGNSTTTYKNKDITSLMNEKPSTVSFGFWLKESDIDTVFYEKPMEFWTVYQNGSCMKVKLPLVSMMENIGTYSTITPETTTINNIFLTYSVSAACTARDSGWAHFVCNMENLTYPENYNAKTSYFYLNLSNVSGILRQENKIEMSNFTFLFNNKIESGYIVYPQTASESFKCAVKGVQDGKYAIDAPAVKGDISITAKGEVISVIKEYNVSYNEVYTEITASPKAYNNADFEFSVSADENTEIYSVYAEIEKTIAKNRNANEGYSASTSFLNETEDTTALPEIKMAEDKDSPMAGVLSYKRVIKDKLNANTTTTYKNKDITSIMNEKPSTVSFGFWVKENDIETVYGEKPMEFWTVYQNGSCMKIKLPLVSMMENIGTYSTITPETTTINNIFLTYSVSAVCTARDSGWAHFVCNMENLTYPENYNAKTSYFYLYLANVSEVLRQDNKIEMSNFTFLTNNKIKSGYIVYPSSDTLSFKAAVKKDGEGKYVLDKSLIMGNIKINALASINPKEGYVPRMKCRISGNEFYVRTSFDDKNDLLQKFRGVNKESLDSNDPFDFTNAGLVSKTSESMTAIDTLLTLGGDEATPFKFNSSYIGANHGQSNGILVTATAHGKTYADIGSLWKDSAGVKWNLLKITDENKLLFLSENMSSDINKYSFKNTLSGVLTHVECAENTKDITVESAANYQQVFPSINKLEKTIYAIIDGDRYVVQDGLTTECDYIEVVERYQIINPATIGKALRDARPEGGYKEAQSVAVGEPIVNYNMTYRFMPDGTVLSIFDHEILENISFLFYGGIQYMPKKDAFGGGVYRYIPKIKELSYSDSKYDFTEPINMTTLTYPSGFSVDLTKNLWDSSSAPDRQVDYMKNASSEICASFSGGYLPVLDGEIELRSKKINAAGFVYNTKKTYPYFLDAKAFETSGTKNQRIRGVAYKKYNGKQNSDISYYTIPYGQDTYIYIDCHEISTRELDLPDLIKDGVSITEVEKTENVKYAVANGKINIEMSDGTYGYFVLKITSAKAEPVGFEKVSENKEIIAKIKNNTHADETVQVVVATYSGNQLKELKTEPIKLKDFEVYRYKETFDELSDSDNVKVFVWDGLSSLIPIAQRIN